MNRLNNPISRRVTAGLKRLHSLLGNPTFTWHGVEVDCVSSTERRGQPIELGGFQAEVALTLFVLRDKFQTIDSTLQTIDGDLWSSFGVSSHQPRPVAGRTLTFQGRSYRILSAREPSPRSHYELDLGDPGQ